MRCKTCEYPLWTIRSRVCPECGSPFAPSDYEFNLNSVRFCCPHCDQQYFGTAPNGHLEPRSFECRKCHRFIDMDEMVLLPREGIDEKMTEVRRLPWGNEERSFFSRFFGQVGWGMTRPQEVGRGITEQTSASSALGFGLLINIVSLVFGVGALVLLFVLPMAMGRGGGGAAVGGGLFGIGVVVGVSILGWLIGVAIWGALTHWLIGGIGRERVTIGQTVSALCLTSGPMLLIAVPCLGPYLLQYPAMIWWMVSSVLAMHALHGCGGLRATLATIAPPLVLVAAMVGFFVFAVFGAVATARTAATAAMVQATARSDEFSAMALAGTVSSYRLQQRGGQFPVHGVELMGGGALNAATMVSGGDPAREYGAKVNGHALGEYAFDPALVREAIDALPSGVIAHRVGDFVFTWHGITPSTDPNLWIAVMVPPPSNVGPFGSSTTWWAVEADGDVTEVPLSTRQADLAAQNRMRAGYGLAPLPDLETVLDDQPATR